MPGWKKDQHVPCLNIVDSASSLQQCAKVRNEETAEIKQVYLCIWKRPYGSPSVVRFDSGRAYVGEALKDIWEQDSVDVDHGAGEKHWHIAKCERHGQWLQAIMKKIIDDVQPKDESEWNECLVAALDQKNRLLRKHGYSPYQHVFGRDPPLPAELLNDDPDPISISHAVNDENFSRSMSIRLAARLAIIAYNDDEAIRKALDARPRPDRPFRARDRVAYWRRGRGAGKKNEARWHGRATILGQEGDDFWLVHAGSLLKACPEHMRYATNEEKWADENVPDFLKNPSAVLKSMNKNQNIFHDLTKTDKPSLRDRQLPLIFPVRIHLHQIRRHL